MQDALGGLVRDVRRSPGSALVMAGLLVAMAITPAVFDPNIYDNFTLPKQASLMVATALIISGLALEGQFLPRERWLRLAIIAWIGWTTLAFALGINRRLSVFGIYQYRQGYVTFLAYAALFLAAFSAARRGYTRWLLVAGLVGFAAVAGYTAIQSLGRDPVTWWIDTSQRAIGTIGNANELASYAVIAIAFAGTGMLFRTRYRLAFPAVIAATTAYVVLQSESRSGLAACGVVMLLFPVIAFARRQANRDIAIQWSVLAGGAVIGVMLSLFSGGAIGTADRVQTAIIHADSRGTQDVTRIQLWRGTVPAILASPLWGVGPDSLAIAFPEHRPANLGGAFATYDLFVQSSHNLILDTAAETGFVGLALTVSLVALVAIRSLRSPKTRGPDPVPFVISAMGGYVALTMLNPLSLAPHATFFVLLGVLAGMAPSEERATRAAAVQLPARTRLAAVLPAVLVLLTGAALLRLADAEAQQGWADYATGRFADAAVHYGAAVSLMPFEHRYARYEGESWLAQGASGNRDALAQAEQTYEGIESDFGLTSGDAMELATARIGLRRPANEILPIVDTMVHLNPHGVTMASYAATLRQAALNGGTLQFKTKDLWVAVTPDSPGQVTPLQ